MLDLIEQHRGLIEALCRKYRVSRLELFGSAARGDFDPQTSDLDFFYDFFPGDTADAADRFFGFLNDLQTLLGRSVDLVHEPSARNTYFLESANRNKVQLYAA